MPIDGLGNEPTFVQSSVSAQHTESVAPAKTEESSTARVGQAALHQAETSEPKPVQEHQVQSLEKTLIDQAHQLHHEIGDMEKTSPHDQKLSQMKNILNKTRNLLLQPYRATMEKIANESTKHKDPQNINALKQDYASTKRALEVMESKLPPESVEAPSSASEFSGNHVTLGNLRHERDLLQAKDRNLSEENRLDKLNRQISKIEKQQAAYQEKGSVEGGAKSAIPAKTEKKNLPEEIKIETPKKQSFSFLRSLLKAAEGILQFFNVKAQYSKETQKEARAAASRDIGTFTREGKQEREVQRKAFYDEILAQGKVFQGVPKKYTLMFNIAKNWCRAENALIRNEAELKKLEEALKKLERNEQKDEAAIKEVKKNIEIRQNYVDNSRKPANEGRILLKKDFEQMTTDIEKLRSAGMEKTHPKEFNQLVNLHQELKNICFKNGELQAPDEVTFANWAKQFPMISPEELMRRIDGEITMTFFSEKLDKRTVVDLTNLKNTFLLLISSDSANRSFIESCEHVAGNLAQMIAANGKILEGLKPGERLNKEQYTAMQNEISSIRDQITPLKIPEGEYKNAYMVAKEKMLIALTAYENRLKTVEPAKTAG